MSRTILEIESLYKTYGEKENAAEALRNLVSSISGRIPRNYGKQRFGKNDAVKLYCFGFKTYKGEDSSERTGYRNVYGCSAGSVSGKTDRVSVSAV